MEIFRVLVFGASWGPAFAISLAVIGRPKKGVLFCNKMGMPKTPNRGAKDGKPQSQYQAGRLPKKNMRQLPGHFCKQICIVNHLKGELGMM
ncbi:MAG: hypothetical protein CM15mP46_6800 [Alphaproteobacteria bacterium]|nr:MAG: hypothetical protein CM15mP46_6800 [Alphaproteobacteria bacterium]